MTPAHAFGISLITGLVTYYVTSIKIESIDLSETLRLDLRPRLTNVIPTLIVFVATAFLATA